MYRSLKVGDSIAYENHYGVVRFGTVAGYDGGSTVLATFKVVRVRRTDFGEAETVVLATHRVPVRRVELWPRSPALRDERRRAAA